MGFRRYVAPSAREALERIRKELGSEAVILSNRRIGAGRVEIIAAAPREMQALVDDFAATPPRESFAAHEHAVMVRKPAPPAAPLPAASPRRTAPETFQEFIRRQSPASMPQGDALAMYTAVAQDLGPSLASERAGARPLAAFVEPRTEARAAPRAAPRPAPLARAVPPQRELAPPFPAPAVFRRRPSRAEEEALAPPAPPALGPATAAPPDAAPVVAAPVVTAPDVAAPVVVAPVAAVPVAATAPAAAVPATLMPSAAVAQVPASAADRPLAPPAPAAVLTPALLPAAALEMPAAPVAQPVVTVAADTLASLRVASVAQAPTLSAAPAAAASLAVPDARVMAELHSLRSVLSDRINSLEAQIAPVAAAGRNSVAAAGMSAGKRRAMTRMIMSGFSPDLARRVGDVTPAALDPREADNWLQKLIAQHIRCPAEPQNPLYGPGAIALVGPTGVGKTTTIAKLAARFVVRHGAAALGLVTLDSYRIGAHEQLRSYGRILGVAVHSAHDAASLRDLLGAMQGKRQVLIDTCGMSQRDPRLGEMLEMLAQARFGGQPVQRVLLVNAASHAETLDEVARSWQVDRAQGAVLTKIDEAARIGGALDALLRFQIPLLGLTNGQRVPEDWHAGNPPLLAHIALKPFGAAFALDGAELHALSGSGALLA